MFVHTCTYPSYGIRRMAVLYCSNRINVENVPDLCMHVEERIIADNQLASLQNVVDEYNRTVYGFFPT